MARIICVASAKGGVGKTTVVSNLATALSEMNHSVVAIDGNTTTSNLGIHLGMPLYPSTIQDVMRGKAKMKEAMYYHPHGFRVIPAGISLSDVLVPKSKDFMDIFYNIKDADFILIDSAAGLGREANETLKASDEMIVVTNPEMPALTDALKLINMAKRYNIANAGVIVNKVKRERHEVSLDEIEKFLGAKVIGYIDDHKDVRESISKENPVVKYKPGSVPARQFKSVASHLAGDWEFKPRRKGFWLFDWLRFV